ncbi:MAG: ribulose-phosphate 3-epimerase [Candidatus Latescibacterota bacterium]|jgi:ribulose-phosphate 3-epimerase
MPKIAPSFLSADFSRLAHQIREVEKSGAEYIHLDVMDGHFVPNISFGPLVVDAVRKKTDLVLDVHVMISHPGQYVQDFADAGADILTVHVEVEEDVPDLLGRIQDAGMKPGATLRPGTPIETLFPLLPHLYLALVMSVEPGFGGQSFMPESLQRVRALKAEIDRLGLETEIEIDGGIGINNAREAAKAGVDVLVAGSAAFRGGTIVENVAAIRQAAMGV